MIDRVLGWITVEPTIALLMIVTAIVLFATALQRRQDGSNTFWPWLRRIIEASIGAILFIGLLWAFRSILTNNNTTFNQTHGSRSEVNYQSAQTIWGRPHTQQELNISHSIEVTIEEEIPREDPTLPPVYRSVKTRQDVPQNSIIGFKGDVSMQLSEREKGYALYSGFLLDARFEYLVINDSAWETDASFYFPLSPGQTLYENFAISVDGRDLSSELRFQGDAVTWRQKMAPGRQETVVITYRSRGMDFFYYQVPRQREIKNFILIVNIDRLPTNLLNYPDGVLTPTEIQATPDGLGSILTWRLDRAVTTAGMGVMLPTPEQPGAQVTRVLWNSPYALTLLIAILALTLLIRGEAVHFLDLALLSAAYCVQFLVMAAVSDYFLGFWGSLILGALSTLLLTYLLFRKRKSRLLQWLIYGLVIFFTILYPLSGLLPQVSDQNAFDSLVQVGMIVYIFGLTLFTRVQQANQKISNESTGGQK
ncbi:MAG TPA: hypothetical protein VFF78_08040 [Anaerolineaceae bacterium]|nr:hypothetical protein [Anaerolineaceae bacterium]